MDKTAEIFTLWIFVYIFTVFTALYLWRREFRYRGGETIRASERPLHYWAMMFVMLCACLTCWALAASRTWPK